VAVQDLKIVLTDVQAARNNWSLTAQGTLYEGTHLINGAVGSGKSTLALMLAGLFSPVSGHIERKEVSSLMVSFQYPEYHTTGNTLEEECSSWGLDPFSLLTSANLTGKKTENPMKLSRGELKMLHLACVLAGSYDLLILDEPFSSLDCYGKEQICKRLSERSTGITVIFTHEQTIFPRIDRIWEIRHGELCDRGGLPEALGYWYYAPKVVKNLISAGKTPKNITPKDLLEAACRT
jgi:energy-coupling factor transport system ATP-binding protein